MLSTTEAGQSMVRPNLEGGKAAFATWEGKLTEVVVRSALEIFRSRPKGPCIIPDKEFQTAPNKDSARVESCHVVFAL